MVPIIEAVQTLNRYGMEVVSGIILGLDTDTPDTGKHLLEFIERSQIPMLTINLLQALPRTPLWDRLKREQRLIEDDDGRESNVAFRLPYEQVRREVARMHARWPIARTRSMPATSTRSGRPIPIACNPPDSALRAPTWSNLRRGADHHRPHHLARRRARRLSARVLAVCLAAAARGPDRAT